MSSGSSSEQIHRLLPTNKPLGSISQTFLENSAGRNTRSVCAEAELFLNPRVIREDAETQQEHYGEVLTSSIWR